MTTEAAAEAAAEAATTSAPHESPDPRGRPSEGAAAARSGQLYARHHRMVLGLCRALLRDPAEAEDAAQQTFLSAHRALLNGSDPREGAAWLAAIARNECWSRTSARMRRPLPSEALEDVAASGGDPVAEAIRRADLAALWRAIRVLPHQQRDALLLREFGGLAYDELAAALAVSEPAVESLLFRARSRLRTQLKAAYAALTGASWLESLVRLGAGGAPAAATKAVALGLGAAAVTGSAVVAPTMLEHHAPPARPRVHVVPRAAPRRLSPPVAVAAAPTLQRVAVRKPAAEPAVRRVLRAAPAHRASDDSHAAGAEDAPTTASRSHETGRVETPSRREHGTDDRAATETPETASQGGGDTSSADGSSGDGSSGGQEGSTTTEAILTVTLPEGDSSSGGEGDG